MLKLKNIEKKLNDSAWRSDNGQHLYIKSCALGHNFYDYGEDEPEEIDFSYHPDLKKIENDPRIIIITCGDCCGCAGW